MAMGGLRMNLKDSATHILFKELQASEMLAIYLMTSGAEMSENVTRLDLSSIISMLCKRIRSNKANNMNAFEDCNSVLPNDLNEDNLDSYLSQMPDSLTKLDLTKMIYGLCQKLGWVKEDNQNTMEVSITSQPQNKKDSSKDAVDLIRLPQKPAINSYSGEAGQAPTDGMDIVAKSQQKESCDAIVNDISKHKNITKTVKKRACNVSLARKLDIIEASKKSGFSIEDVMKKYGFFVWRKQI